MYVYNHDKILPMMQGVKKQICDTIVVLSLVHILQIMLLTILGCIVGPVNTWPTLVIRAIFIDMPSLASIKAVVAFFYGNGVPFFMVHQLFVLCNYHAREGAILSMRLLYEIWQAQRFQPHQAVYYMTCKADVVKRQGCLKWNLSNPCVGHTPWYRRHR